MPVCHNGRVTEQQTASNLAVRILHDAATARDLVTSNVGLDDVPDTAADAIRVWATQRGVPLDSVEPRGGALKYAGRAVYCFRFRTSDRYNGVVCIDGDGTVLGEDSRVSAWPSN